MPRYSLVLLLSSLLVVAWAPCAQSGVAGAYAGRSPLIGQQDIRWEDRSGTVPLAERGTRLAGERLYAGYRFRSGLGVEGMQVQSAARDLSSTIDTVALAGTLSIALADKVVATAKAGLHVAESSLGAAAARPGQLAPEKLFGIGIAYRASPRVELTADSQRFDSRSAQALGPIPAQTYLIGAHLHF
jgi:hypothetical protein